MHCVLRILPALMCLSHGLACSALAPRSKARVRSAGQCGTGLRVLLRRRRHGRSAGSMHPTEGVLFAFWGPMVSARSDNNRIPVLPGCEQRPPTLRLSVSGGQPSLVCWDSHHRRARSSRPTNPMYISTVSRGFPWSRVIGCVHDIVCLPGLKW